MHAPDSDVSAVGLFLYLTGRCTCIRGMCMYIGGTLSVRACMHVCETAQCYWLSVCPTKRCIEFYLKQGDIRKVIAGVLVVSKLNESLTRNTL